MPDIYNDYNNSNPINELIPDTSGYEDFYICVKDIAGNPINGATVAWEYTGNIDTTKSNGMANERISVGQYLDFDSENVLSCHISKTGYVDKTVDIPKGQHTSSATAYEVTLEQESNQHYYSVIYVKENNQTPVPNVTVQIFDSSDGTTCINDELEANTDSNGMCIYAGSIGNNLYCRVSKNGFNSSSLKPITTKTSIVDAENSPNYITITRSASADYYYVIKVVDDSGNGVPNIKVGVYKDISYSEVYTGITQNEGVSSSSTFDDIFSRVRVIIGNEIGCDPEDIKKNTAFYDLNISQIKINHIIDAIENEYQVNLVSEGLDQSGKVEDFLDSFNFVSEVVDFIQHNSNIIIGYVTDSNGYIVFSVGRLSSQPKPIYAKGLFNTGVLWNLRQGTVQPTTNSNDPGIILRINSSDDELDLIKNYYNFKVVDDKAGIPVKNVDVTYSKNNKEIKTIQTDSNGFVRYSSDYPRLEVTFYKDGYNKLTSNFPGGNSSNTYNEQELLQQNSIRVIYGSECENPGEPAQGIVVSIGYYNDKNAYVEKGRYITYESGYIDCLPSGYFSPSKKYFGIITNYEVDSLNISALKKILVGSITFELPPRKTSSDQDETPEVIPEEISEYIPFYDMTANSIKNNVNNGNISLKNGDKNTTKVKYSGGDDYMINVLDPDSITTYDIFESKPIRINNNQKSVIGSANIGLKSDVNKLKLKVINRYSGYYNPIFKDVLFYKNLTYDNNILPFSNVGFDYDYNDKYGKFGVINNMWFHKVNDDKDIKILNTLTPYYPLIGQYALDFRDYNIFESNWDIEHYTKQMDVEHSKPYSSIGSMNNGICMFGSKYLNVPNQIEIYGLTLGNDPNWNGEWNDDWIINQDGCPGEVMFKEVNDNSVDFYFFFTKRIQRFFYDKLKDEFEKYMDKDTSYGTTGVEDDIKDYVAKNVLKLYRLEKVRMFVKRTKIGQHNSKIENDYTTYLEYDKTSDDPDVEFFNNKGYVYYFKQKGFVEVKNLTLSKINRDDFDRKLVYNLRNGSREEFGFSFILTKI